MWALRTFGVCLCSLAMSSTWLVGGELEPVPESFAGHAGKFLETYCFECHGMGSSEGGVELEEVPLQASDRATRDVWRKIMQHLQVGTMPPPDHSPLPEPAVRNRFVQSIDAEFFDVDCEKVRDPGRVTIRRLNRVEYENTILDLLGVVFRSAESFPRDDVGYGFDNIGDVLSLSPPLLEKYLDAAEIIARRVIYTGPRAELRLTRVLPGDFGGENRAGLTIENGFLLVNREGYASAEFSPYEPGEYELRIRAFGVQWGDELVRMAVEVAGERVAEFEIQGHHEADVYRVRLTFGDGHYPLGHQDIHFVYLNDFNEGGDADRDLGIWHAELDGPLHLDAQTMPFPPQHRKAISVEPDQHTSVEEAARRSFLRLARRAFRQPVGSADVELYVDLATHAVAQGETYEKAMQLGLQAILVSPKFLFRVESPARPDDSSYVDAVGQFELASRLSYFLWSTMPDEALMAAAEEGKLTQPDILMAQVERMLESPRSEALVGNFAGQWLNLRNLDDARPNRQLFPEFNEQLADDMQRETRLLVEHLLREDKSLMELLSADYSFVNERLAGLYGLEGVTGNEFRRVSLTDLPRRGVLTHAGILTLTSDPARTLPVKRGKWILETILGQAPPPPPPNVPALEATEEANPEATLREQLARHREDASCAACHQAMDPLGLAFENYDAIGRWRDSVHERPIDASGTLPDGRSFSNAIELTDLLRQRETEYAEQITRALLTFALGRGLEPYDQCAVDQIVSVLKQSDYRFRTLLNEIVLSRPFRMRRGDGGKP